MSSVINALTWSNETATWIASSTKEVFFLVYYPISCVLQEPICAVALGAVINVNNFYSAEHTSACVKPVRVCFLCW